MSRWTAIVNGRALTLETWRKLPDREQRREAWIDDVLGQLAVKGIPPLSYPRLYVAVSHLPEGRPPTEEGLKPTVGEWAAEAVYLLGIVRATKKGAERVPAELKVERAAPGRIERTEVVLVDAPKTPGEEAIEEVEGLLREAKRAARRSDDANPVRASLDRRLSSPYLAEDCIANLDAWERGARALRTSVNMGAEGTEGTAEWLGEVRDWAEREQRDVG